MERFDRHEYRDAAFVAILHAVKIHSKAPVRKGISRNSA